MSGRDLASVSWSDNPLAPIASTRAVEPGTLIGSLLPEGWEGRRVVCKYNGRWILRAGWACPVQAGDVVEFHEQVEGRNGLRTVLSILIVVAAIVTQQYYAAQYGLAYGAAAGAAVSIAGNLALNALLPVEGPRAGNQEQSFASVYNVAVSGNQARVDQAIPVIYGRHLVKPDYVGEPYYIFDANGDQYGYFVYCIAQGRYAIEQELIGRTQLGSLQDVTVHRKLEPGELPTSVLSTVVTSREVVSLDMPAGRRIGGYAVCRPGARVTAIGIDFVCPRGQAIPITVQVGIREINDAGNPVSLWSVLGTETVTGDTSKPTRRSYLYTLPRAYRAEVRVSRLTAHDDSASVPNEIEWAGMRGYLDAVATLCPTATHYELIIRASEQLSGLSANQFALVVQRLLRVWTPGGWTAPGAEVATRNPFHAQMDAWTNVDYVHRPLSDERVDLATLHRLALQADLRQDRCDVIFDSFTSGWEVANVICRTGRAKPFRRNGVHTVARDEPQALTVTAFDSRSILPGSFGASYVHPTGDLVDGVLAEYFDYRAWDWVEIECPAPGYTVTDPLDPRYNPALPAMVKPERKRYRAITGPKHAEREGLYDAGVPKYRRKSCSLGTELQGMLPAFGSDVLVAPALAKYAQSGDVAFWTGEVPYLMGLTEPVRFEPGASHIITLTRDDGSLHPPIAVLPGPTPNEVYLAAAPDFELIVDDGTRERPRYQFGSLATYRQHMRVTGITHQGVNDEGVHTYALTTVADDARLHVLDEHLLPAPGEVQDILEPSEPGAGGGEGGAGEGGGIPVVLSDNRVYARLFFTDSFTDFTIGLSINNDGTITNATEIPGASSGIGYSQWLLITPVSDTIAAEYDVRFEYVGTTFGTLAVSAPALDTWMSLGTSRTVRVTGSVGTAGGLAPYPGNILLTDGSDRASGVLRVRIRDAFTLVEQGSALLSLRVVASID